MLPLGPATEIKPAHSTRSARRSSSWCPISTPEPAASPAPARPVLDPRGLRRMTAEAVLSEGTGHSGRQAGEKIN